MEKEVTQGKGFTIEQLVVEITSGATATRIKRKAKQLARGCFRQHEEDYEQDLKLHLFRRWIKYQPSRAHWNVFAKTLIERHSATIAKKRKALKRFGRTTVSLDADCSGTQSLADSIPEDRSRAHAGIFPSGDEHRMDAAMDVESLLARLSEEDQQLCQQRMENSSTTVSKRLGIPRTTLRRQIRSFRKLF